MARRRDPESIEGRIYTRLQRLIEARKRTPGFAGNAMQVLTLSNDHVFGFVRTHGDQRVVVLANFTETGQAVRANEVRLYGLGYRFTELIPGTDAGAWRGGLVLEPYQVLWLRRGRG